MNANTKILALMAALAAGSAFAQSSTPVRTGNTTNAGTTISNTATASFDDPEKPGTEIKVPSNTVTTTVAAKQAFDITYASGADSDATDTVAGAAVEQLNVVPGQWVAFEYVAVNNGNAEQTITLSTEVSGGVNASTVKYYLGAVTVDPKTGAVTGTELPKDGSGNYQIQNLKPSGDDPSTTAVETNSGTQTFTMVYQVPTNIARGAAAGASPVGTAQVWDGTANVTVTEQKDATGAAYDDLFWQFNRVTATTPNVTTTPPTVPPTTPLPPYDPNDPGKPGLVVTPPQNPGKPVDPANPGTGTPNDPVDPADDPSDPNVPSNPGYKRGTTVIAITGNRQDAYPVNGVTSVTFTNIITNTGSLTDTVTLIPPTGLPAGVTVTFPGTDADPNTPGFQVTVPQGQTVSYEVKVDFPSTPNSTTALTPISVVIGVDSGNDSDSTADASTTDVVHPPAFRFGDDNGSTTFGTDPTTKVTQAVVPGANTATNITNSTADNVAVFPMNLENTGNYNETYTLSATVTLTGATATVRYFDASGTELPKDGNGNYISPVVGAGQEITVYAVVVVPTATQSGTYTLTQTATANYSGISVTDTNDDITVGIIGGVAMAKFVQGGTGGSSSSNVTAPTGYGTGAGPSVAPGGTISYVVIGKNTYNTTVKGVVLTDILSTNVTYGSATCAVYDVSNTVVGGKTCTASNSGGTVTTTAVNLASGEYVRLDLSVTVK